MNKIFIDISSAFYTVYILNDNGVSLKVNKAINSTQFFTTTFIDTMTNSVTFDPTKMIYDDASISFSSNVYIGGNLIDINKQVVDNFYHVIEELKSADEIYILYTASFYNQPSHRLKMVERFKEYAGQRFKGMYSKALLTDAYILASALLLNEQFVIYHDGQLYVTDLKKQSLYHQAEFITSSELHYYYNKLYNEYHLDQHFDIHSPFLRKAFSQLANHYAMGRKEDFVFEAQDRKLVFKYDALKEYFEKRLENIYNSIPNYGSSTGYCYDDVSKFVNESLYEIFKRKGFEDYLGKHFLDASNLLHYCEFVSLLNNDSNIRFNIKKNANKLHLLDGENVYLIRKQDCLGAKQEKYRKMQMDFFNKKYILFK